MRARFGLFALITAGLLMAAASVVSAQTSTTGALRGVITDQATGQPVVGATVVASGPALQGTQAEITDSSGSYQIANLPPGTYLLKVYYSGIEFERPNALVQLGKVAQVNIGINTQATAGEVIQIEGRAPIIDQGSAKTGLTITSDYTQNIPTGRTFGGVLGTAAGSQGDLYGVSFGGSTSAENVYIVEGINTTDPAYGLQSTNLPNEFIQETEVITGGYNAEYGRSTGGVINVLTKSGSNEFHGSVFSYLTPGGLTAAEVPSPRSGSSIDRVNELAYEWDVGAEIGGPIVKDRLWFHVGFNPSFRKDNVHRIIKSQVDRDGDEQPDVDANGFRILEEVDRTTLNRGGRTMFFTAKLSGAISPDHQGSLAFLGNPEKRDNYVTVTGVPEAGLVDIERGAWDVAAKWTSKFMDNRTQVNAVLGYHRNANITAPHFPDIPQVRINPATPLSQYDAQEMVYGGTPAACLDGGPDDLYPGITNCPVTFYNLGGVGFHDTQATDRLSALLSLTQRVKMRGHHTFKVGLDVEDQGYDRRSVYTGGVRYIRRPANWRVDRWYSLVGTDTELDELCDIGGDELAPCRFLEDGTPASTATRNLGFYAQDSWAILPNLTFNAGLRWERQTLFTAKEIAGTTAPDTGEPIGDVAFEINNMLAPRLGLIFDPTQEGRAKINVHWGRFYESIPMDINARAFGGEVYNIRIVSNDFCTQNPEQVPISEFMCDQPGGPVFNLGGGTELVDPDIKGQYMDELVLGGEYELFNDVKVGANYIHRELGRAIEDISADGGVTYQIANPGLGVAAGFDDPTRVYDALQLIVEKRFTNNVMAQSSYTLSRLHGNFPGLFSPETGQLDPNLTSMYDLPDLMANRTGPLAADRTHLFKVDGYYRLDARELGSFVFGTSVRASSGIPHNVLGAHAVYGSGETYILPRGSAQRSPFTTRFDLHAAYGRKLSSSTALEAFVRVYNVFNQQPEMNVDENYTFDDVNPCATACDTSDLRHMKVAGENRTIEVNPNFGNVNIRQAPVSAQFGVRLTF
jgi:outer membrane receptor protein involved in Fe transport